MKNFLSIERKVFVLCEVEGYLLKREFTLVCLCGSSLDFDDFEYYCRNCGDVRFPRYVCNTDGEIDLIDALEIVSKDRIRVMERRVLEQGSTIIYFAITYTFKKLGQAWKLTDVNETSKTWEDADPQVISDEIQLLNQESSVEFYFSE